MNDLSQLSENSSDYFSLGATKEGVNTLQDYLLELKPPLSKEEERSLALRVAAGDTLAREEFIERNLRLVVHIARSYRSSNMEFLDLIQEGNVGLIKAVDKYDLEKGVAFSTYATYWIKRAIIRAISSKSRNIRFPDNIYPQFINYRKLIKKYKEQGKKIPGIQELAQELEISPAMLRTFIALHNDTRSLSEQTILEENLEETIACPLYVEEQIAKEVMKEEVQELLKKCHLKEREIEILKMRCGFDDQEPKSLEAIGEYYGLTKARIGQIEKEAIAKMRSYSQIFLFARYMDFPERAIKQLVLSQQDYESKKKEDRNRRKIKAREKGKTKVAPKKKKELEENTQQKRQEENTKIILLLEELKGVLSTQELIVLSLALGFPKQTPVPFQEIALRLNITVEEVKEILQKARAYYQNRVKLSEEDCLSSSQNQKKKLFSTK